MGRKHGSVSAMEVLTDQHELREICGGLLVQLDGEDMKSKRHTGRGNLGLITAIATRSARMEFSGKFNVETKADPVKLSVDAIVMRVRESTWTVNLTPSYCQTSSQVGSSLEFNRVLSWFRVNLSLRASGLTDTCVA
jgi:FAD/FMN-containing dehydrogenase